MVAIKDFEIPSDCLHCPIYIDRLHEVGYCSILRENNIVSGLKRLDDCPLVEMEEEEC